MKLNGRFLLPLTVFMVAISASTVHAQTVDTTSAMESLRADARADKTKVITVVMQFSPKDADAFWPVYKRYEADLAKINDQRIGIIKEYASSFSSLTDQQASSLTTRSLDYERQRVDLEKKYFKEFSKVLPGVTVAKFFQLEHRLNLLVDLDLASNLPTVFEAPAQ